MSRRSLRQIRDEHRRQIRDAYRPALEDGQADHHRLGDPVEHGSQHDSQRGAALLAAGGVLAITSPRAADQPVATEEDQTAGEDARSRPAVPGSFLDGLLDQVEGERADQHPGAEAHDQADHAQADAEAQRDEGADHQRGSRKDSPTEGCCHPYLPQHSYR